jgi:hypothetical protein
MARVSLFVAIDILTRHDDAIPFCLEGHLSSTARELLALVACALHRLCVATPVSQTVDLDTRMDFIESFSFSEVRKRNLQTRFSFVLYDTISDKDTLLNCGGIILPMGRISLLFTFFPTADDTIRTSLPKEIRLALRRHKALLYQ